MRLECDGADSSGGPVRHLDRVLYHCLGKIRDVDRDPDAGRIGTMSIPSVPLGGALDVTLTRDELDRLEPLSRQMVGARY